MANHAQEFPTFEVPSVIDGLVAAGVLEDRSWHNDISPSFRIVGTRQLLWADHQTPDMREFPETPRFNVYEYSDEDCVEDPTEKLSTDDIEAVKLYIANASPEVDRA